MDDKNCAKNEQVKPDVVDMIKKIQQQDGENQGFDQKKKPFFHHRKERV